MWDYECEWHISKKPQKKINPINVHGVIVAYQDSVQINTRGKNTPPGTFEMYNTRDKHNSVVRSVEEMGQAIVALTSHAVSVRIW
jgi:hypothetical protein